MNKKMYIPSILYQPRYPSIPLLNGLSLFLRNLSIFKPTSDDFDFLDITLILIRSLQYERKSLKCRVQRYPLLGFRPEKALSQLFMAVLMGPSLIPAVVKVDRLKTG